MLTTTNYAKDDDNEKITVFTGSTLLAFAITGCGGSEKQAPAAAKAQVKLGMLRLTSSAPLFIAMDKGFFAEQNIEIQPEWFDAAHPIAVATASSQVDVGATGITASLFNMAASGQQLAIVADKGREEKGFPSSALVAAANAYNNGFTSWKALKANASALRRKVLPSIICWAECLNRKA